MIFLMCILGPLLTMRLLPSAFCAISLHGKLNKRRAVMARGCRGVSSYWLNACGSRWENLPSVRCEERTLLLPVRIGRPHGQTHRNIVPRRTPDNILSQSPITYRKALIPLTSMYSCLLEEFSTFAPLSRRAEGRRREERNA